MNTSLLHSTGESDDCAPTLALPRDAGEGTNLFRSLPCNAREGTRYLFSPLPCNAGEGE
jgi:hypothetical protein